MLLGQIATGLHAAPGAAAVARAINEQPAAGAVPGAPEAISFCPG